MFQRIIEKIGIPESIRQRVYFLWGLTFLYQIGFMIAWIVITALFIESFGIEKLLFLFLVEACFMLLGGILAREISFRFPLKKFMLVVMSTLLLIVGAAIICRENGHILAFFFLALVAKDLVYPRIRIGLMRKTEEFFVPKRAEQAMPTIESGITIGTITSAGLMLFLLKYFVAASLLAFWLVPLALIFGMLLLEEKLLNEVPGFEPEMKSEATQPFFDLLKLAKKIPFLKFLCAVVFLQAALFTVTDFHFMQELDSHTTHSNHVEIEFSFPKDLQASLFDQVAEKTEKLENFAVEKIETVSSHLVAHKNLTHDLSALSLIFGLIALVVQLFLTTKCLRRFGIIHSMMLYFSGFFAIATTLIFNGSMINFVRGYQHGFHSLFLSGYHITFYSTFKKYREFLRIFLEGMLTPIAVILSSGIMILLLEKDAGDFLPLLMAFLAAGLIGITFWMRKSFTQISVENFRNAPNLAEKLLATEMLGQRGHRNSMKILSRELLDEAQHPILREKIIRTLTEIDDPRVVHPYIQILREQKESDEIKIYVLDSLLKCKNLQNYCAGKAFTQHQLLQILQTLFATTEHEHLKKLLVMNILNHLPLSKTVGFLQHTLKNADEKLQSICLRSCKIFNDPEIVNYLEPYLTHSNPRIRSHCVIAMWEFADQEKLWSVLEPMLESENPEILISGIYATGEIGHRDGMQKIYQYLKHEHPEVRLHTLITLGKMGDTNALPGLLEIFLGDDKDFARRAYEMSKRIAYQLQEKLEQNIHRAVAKKVFEVLAHENIHSHENLKNLSPEKLNFLKRMYRLSGKYEHLCVIEGISK